MPSVTVTLHTAVRVALVAAAAVQTVPLRAIQEGLADLAAVVGLVWEQLHLTAVLVVWVAAAVAVVAVRAAAVTVTVAKVVLGLVVALEEVTAAVRAGLVVTASLSLLGQRATKHADLPELQVLPCYD